MNNPGGPGGRQGGQGSQGSPNMITSTTTAQAQTTSFTVPIPTSSATSSHQPTATATTTASASNSTGVQKGVLIGAIIGGLAGLLLLSILVVCFFHWRRRKQLAKRVNSKFITYTGLNNTFTGVPFRRSTQGWHENVSSPTDAPNSTTALRRGDITSDSIGEIESDRFRHSYQNSGVVLGVGYSDDIESPNRNTHTVSPQSSTEDFNLPMIIPRTPPPVASPVSPHRKRDTMGFPVEGSPLLEPTFGEIYLEPESPTPIVSPRPHHPLVHQASLEAAVRDYLRSPESPTLAPKPLNLTQLRIMKQELPTSESPVLGEMHSVRMHHAPENAGIYPTSNNRTDPPLGLRRTGTQRTVDTVSTMGPNVISDEELDRLGVGRMI